MGQIAGTAMTRHLDLKMDDEPTFKPDIGFSVPRKVREKPKATAVQLSSARIPPQFRDYCADELLEYQVCRYKVFPFVYKCHHERHTYLCCEQKDYVLRMKEFERERRLRERELRLLEKPPQPPSDGNAGKQCKPKQ